MNTNPLVGVIVFFASVFCATVVQAGDYVGAVTNTPGLLGYWRFDPVFQTNSIVNGYTGMLVGNAQIGPPGSGCPLDSDPANQALILDGNNSYFTTSPTGQITNSGSVIVWVFLGEEPSDAGHIFQVTSESQDGDDFDFQIQTDNHTYFFTDSGSSTQYGQALPTNEWHFLAATFVSVRRGAFIWMANSSPLQPPVIIR